MKKKRFEQRFLSKELKKLFCIMKLTFFFFLLSSNLVWAAQTYAQVTSLNLELNNVNLEEVFEAIRQQSEFEFFYNNDQVNTLVKVSVKAKEADIEAVLEQVLPVIYEYKIKDRYILINKRQEEISSQSARVQTEVQQQKKTISGKIVDEQGEPVIGANIMEQGTTNGTITDFDGVFSLSVEEDAILHISYIGYLSQEITTKGKSTLQITLMEDMQSLEELVVVGFARQKKANLTGAVSGVNMDDLLKERPVTNTSTLLQGAIPGLQVTSGTGEPGGGYSFNVRGTTSIQGGSPLILVDNVPLTGPLSLINPNDIESVSVLKDGGAAAIYGARGAFGVVLITTKGAKLDQKTKINYTGNLAFTRPSELPSKSSPLETVQAFKDFGYTGSTTWRGKDTDKWIEFLREYNQNPSLYPEGYTEFGGQIYQLKEYDQMKDFIGDLGFQHVHNLSVSGGSNKTSYRVSLGYVDSDGIMVTNKDSYNKYSVKSFLNAQMTSWLTGQVDMNYYQSKKTMPNRGGWSDAVSIPTFVPTGTWNVNGEDILLGTPANMVRLSSTNNDRYYDTRMTGRLIAQPVQELTFTGEFTYDRLSRETVNYNKKITSLAYYDYDITTSPANSIYNNTKRSINNMVLNLFGAYDKSFGDHQLGVLGGFNSEAYYEDYLNAEAFDMINDELPSIDQAIGEKMPGDYFSEYALMGFFGRINYSYKDRYLLEFNGRYDGSSKFPTGHRWGLFPSVSAGWRISEEPFMESLKNVIPELKLRASYATLGNQNISPYGFLATMDISYPWVHDGKQTPTLGTPGLVRNDFTWETIQTRNIGLDITLFRGRFDAVIDIYSRKTKDMLDRASEFPAVVGTSAPMMNVADLESKGWELDLKWRDRIGEFTYNIGFNIYDYKAVITSLPSNKTYSLSEYYKGYEMGTIWGYVTDRFYTEADFDQDGNLLPGIPYPKGITKPTPGDVLFVDYDESGIIDEGDNTLDNHGDMKVIGNSSLRYQYGINGGLGWKNFDFSFYLHGIGKRDTWIANEMTFPAYYEWGVLFTHLSDYWTPDNLNAMYPKGYPNGTKNSVYNSNIRRQTKYLLDGSYLRVKNLAIGYTLPETTTEGWGIQRMKLNASVENPFMFHKLPKGLDPTVDSKGRGLGYPVMRVFSIGVSLDF